MIGAYGTIEEARRLNVERREPENETEATESRRAPPEPTCAAPARMTFPIVSDNFAPPLALRCKVIKIAPV